jgi:hypothetical protein
MLGGDIAVLANAPCDVSSRCRRVTARSRLGWMEAKRRWRPPPELSRWRGP